MEKLKIMSSNILIISVVILGLYLLATFFEQRKADKLEIINKGYELGKGLIISQTFYQGHHFTLKYNIKGVEYKYEGQCEKDCANLKTFDSVRFKYVPKDPKIIVTELEGGY